MKIRHVILIAVGLQTLHACGGAVETLPAAEGSAVDQQSDPCLDASPAIDDLTLTNRWIMFTGPLAVGGDSKLAGFTTVSLPGDAEVLEAAPAGEFGGGWPTVAKRPFAESPVSIAAYEPNISDIQTAKTPVLVGLIHHVAEDVWRIRVSYSVGVDATLTRHLACSDANSRGTSELLQMARSEGYPGTELDLVASSPVDRLHAIYAKSQPPVTAPNLSSDPSRLGAADKRVQLKVDPSVLNSASSVSVCVGQTSEDSGEVGPFCVYSMMGGGEPFEVEFWADSKLDTYVFTLDESGAVSARSEVSQRTLDAGVEVTMVGRDVLRVGPLK
jgi:hypothetical protein